MSDGPKDSGVAVACTVPAMEMGIIDAASAMGMGMIGAAPVMDLGIIGAVPALGLGMGGCWVISFTDAVNAII